jgi:hypothetical protein
MNLFGIRQRPATLNFFLKCLQCISDRLKCLPNRLGSVEWLLNRLVTRHFLPFLKFICSSGIAGSLVHACFFHGTDFLFACSRCSCLPVRVVAVCTFGFLQSRLEEPRSWGGGCCLFLSSLYVVYCCLIRLCRVPVLRLHLGLLVLLGWVLIWCFFLFAQGLQCWDACICGWISGYIFLHFGLHRILLR